MSRGLTHLVLFAGLAMGVGAPTARADAPYVCPRCHRVHAGPGPYRGGSAYAPSPGTSPNGAPGLPRGRRYYGGRYFGTFNDRFYGPQYGYF